jgi:hypothetical protein
MLMAISYYRFGGWREVRLGIAKIGVAPAARA